jgi:pilus assembly protein CpaF
MTEETSVNRLEELMNDSGIREIMVNGPGQMFVERRGRLEAVESVFASSEQVLHAIRQLLAPLPV